ncbi:MAG: GNAT family N-acetyltransferase [Clostridia bacterium]|nr:GNAT family N-acetyltransferase [Clostridia bacterium]
MDIFRIDQADRKEIDDHIIRQWFSLRMVVHGESIDLGTADGWYAYQDGEVVGSITYRVFGDVMEILSLDSLNEHHGTGTTLLDTAVSYARDSGISKIILITTNDNLQALRFYQKRGFDMARLFCNAVDQARKLKPEIPLFGMDGIPLKHEIELEMDL